MSTVIEPVSPASETDDNRSGFSADLDDTLRSHWIAAITETFNTFFANTPDVLVAANLLWYPVEGDDQTGISPDILIAFGRPKGPRSLYCQWEEGDVAPTIVFDVLPAERRIGESLRRFAFFERFGVEEYYHYDPYSFEFSAWVRDPETGRMSSRKTTYGFVSPRLGVLFVPRPEASVAIFGATGRPILEFQEG